MQLSPPDIPCDRCPRQSLRITDSTNSPWPLLLEIACSHYFWQFLVTISPGIPLWSLPLAIACDACLWHLLMTITPDTSFWLWPQVIPNSCDHIFAVITSPRNSLSLLPLTLPCVHHSWQFTETLATCKLLPTTTLSTCSHSLSVAIPWDRSSPSIVQLVLCTPSWPLPVAP